MSKIKNLFSNTLTEEEKTKYNITNYKPKTEEIIYEKPNIIDKFFKFLSEIFS